MPFVKVVKNTAYFKRFQVKYRRRREGKTDYFARRLMVIQDKTKFNTPKYRFVVRKTNTKIICQIVKSTIKGDRIFCQALSSELKNFGLNAGLTNYSAAYCTGLLCARRLLKRLNMDKMYPGIAKATGEYIETRKKKYMNLKPSGGDKKAKPEAKKVEKKEDKKVVAKKVDKVQKAQKVVKVVASKKKTRRGFKAYLDIGISRSTNGNRVFAAMKGACDGGLNIPHSNKIFPGFEIGENKVRNYDAADHRDRIFGQHVQAYMDKIEEENPEKYKKQFSQLIKCLNDNKLEGLEELYTSIHEKIRQNPDFVKKPKRELKDIKCEIVDKDKMIIKTGKGSYLRSKKIPLEAKKKRIAQRIAEAKAQLGLNF